MEEKKHRKTLKEIYDSLTDEQKEKAKACKSVDELVRLAGEERIELPDELMNTVAGGYLFQDNGSKGIEIIRDSDGAYLGSVDTKGLYGDEIWKEARRQAAAKGQSSERLADWAALNRLRDSAKKNNC